MYNYRRNDWMRDAQALIKRQIDTGVVNREQLRRLIDAFEGSLKVSQHALEVGAEHGANPLLERHVQEAREIFQTLVRLAQNSS